MWALQRLAVLQLYLQSIRLQIKNIETMLSTEVDSHWHPLTTIELPFVLRVNVCQFLLISSYGVAGSLEGRHLLRAQYVVRYRPLRDSCVDLVLLITGLGRGYSY